jgi:post-segregation antitoxin (ccd killing protein)
MKQRPIKPCKEGLASGRSPTDLAAQWQKENAAAIAASNLYVETHGLPLAKFRRF